MFRKFMILSFCLSLSAIGVMAQGDDILTETFVSEYGYQFNYPIGWEAEDNPGETDLDDGSILLDDTTDIVVLFYEPQPLEIVGRGRDMVTVMESRWADFIVSGVEEFEDLQGRALVGADLRYEDTPGVGFMVDFGDDTYGLLAAYDFSTSDKQVSEEVLLTLYLIVSSFQPIETDVASSGDGRAKTPATGSSTSTDTLSDYDGAWQDAVRELQSVGVIGSGGSLVFNEPSAFFSGQGSFYTPLASSSPHRDIVMAAELEYIASNATDFETCALMAAVQASGNTTNTYVEVGFANNGTFYFADIYQGDLENVVELASDVNFSRPRHVMFVIQQASMTVFLDGEQIATDIEMIERSGSYGIALTGRAAGANCQGDNIWVYTAPVVTAGLCEVTTASTVNRRNGPGTSFSTAGQFTAGTIEEVVGQNSDGSFTWYKLADNTWVREDVVSLRGDCAQLPRVN